MLRPGPDFWDRPRPARESRPWRGARPSAILARMSLGLLPPLAPFAPLAVAMLLALEPCGPPDPGIPTGAATLRRSVVQQLPELGPIENVVRLAPAPEDGGEVWVGGQNGCARLTTDGAERGRVRFAHRVVNPVPIDVDGDGRWETMACGGGWSDVGLLDAEGHPLWHFPDGAHSLAAADAMAAGPVGPNGSLAFVIGMNGGDGVHFLDVEGARFRHVDGSNVFSVAVADLDGDGAAEIVHSGGGGFGGRIWVRDRDGAPLRRLDAELGFFSLIRWPEPDSPPRLLGIDDDTVQVVDPCVEPDGEVLAEFELPDGGFAEPAGTLVRLAAGAPRFLAVSRTIRATWHRSALYVYDSERRLVYHEVFPHPHLGIVAVPSAAGGAEDLLVGVGTTLWRYSWQPQPPVSK